MWMTAPCYPGFPWLFHVHNSAFPGPRLLGRLKKANGWACIFLHKSKNRLVCVCVCVRGLTRGPIDPKAFPSSPNSLFFGDLANSSFLQHRYQGEDKGPSPWTNAPPQFGHMTFSFTPQIRAGLFNVSPETWGTERKWTQRITWQQVNMITDCGLPSGVTGPVLHLQASSCLTSNL